MKNLIILVITTVAALMTLAPTAAQAQQPQAACESAYTVLPGDWLGKVAAQTYGDAALYPAIAAATNANLGPDYVNFIGANNVILPGWKLCLPSQADAAALAAAATDDPTTLTVDDLQNATYTEYADAAPVTLVNGEYRQPVPDSTGEEVYSLADTFAFADFDGDGSEDALAVLISDTAGTGRFFTLLLMLNKNGVPTQADSVSLGDRSPMKAINLVGDDIYVDYITQGPNDAACCATQATSQKFRVENGKLVTSEADIQASQTSEAMTREKLGNIAYPIDEGEQITFVNGKYVGQPEGEGSASFSAAEMLAPLAFGDLTGDGVEDAVVTFSYSGGGSGDFLYLAVAEGKGAEPVGQASLWLDTAGKINGVTVDNGQVKVDVLRFGPGDAECCATEHAVVTYTLQDGALVEGEVQVITPSAAASEAAALTVAELQNATYSGIYEEPVTLTNGKYEGEPFDEGGSSRPTVEYWGEVFGDLDGDGLEDAAVFLVENSGGTGNFVYVSAQLNQNGQPVDAGTVSIEDRIQVKSAAIENGQIKLEITTEGPGDAACCKSHKTNKTYALQNGQLAEIPGPEETLEKISAADLNGTTWTLLELNPDQSVLADTPVTISFADGKISGSGGCNNYNGGFTLAGDNPFGMTVGPVVSTKMACSDPILNQETAYFTALEKVSQWGYRIGRLVMYYDKGQGEFGTLLFTPPVQEPEMGQAAAPAPGERITSVVELTAVPVQWLSFTDPTQQFDIANPENYTIAFNPDGTVNVKADCNNASGTYTADDNGSLTIEIGPMTKAMCPPNSRSDEFVQKLGFVRNFFMEDGFVYLDMLADGGTLKLAPASESMSAPESTPTFGDAWASVSCDTLGVAPEIGAVADCGYVTVPENRAAGTAKTIQLAVVRVRSTSTNPGSPVVLGTGGPGSNGLQDASDPGFLTSHAGILADRDWVLFSQRGTVGAKPELVCPAYNDVPLQTALNGWTDEEKQAQSIETMQACLDNMKAQGVDLTGYNSVENAADIVDIIHTLGYDKVSYYGQSYGTLLGQYLLRNHPEIVETITLDGIAPASAQRWTDVTDFAAAFQRVFAACAADKACAAAYPDPEGALAEALAAMDANPPMVTVPLPGGESKTIAVDEVLAMNALFINLYMSGGYGKVPFLAYELRDGNYDQLAATLALHFLNSGTARVMHLAMVCSDDPVASLDDVDVTAVPEMYKGVIYDDANSYATFCPRLNLPQLPASSDELPVSDVPALLLQGGLDPATPVEGGNKLVDGLPNNYNVIFPSGSHVQASHSPCALSIFDAFLTDPSTAPDTSCVDPALSFAVPGPVSVSSADGQAVITMTLPAGFVAGPNPGQWNDGAMLFGLEAFEAGTSVAEALEKPMGATPLPGGEAVAGPMIAGYPSLTTQVEMPLNGVTHYFDRFAFSDGERAYRLLVEMTNPATLDEVRQKLVPQVLESITFSNTTTSSPTSGSATPSESGFSAAWESVNCDTFDVPPAVAGMSDCGYLTVPEFHQQPAGPTIQVAVVRVRSSGDNPAPDPLFMEQGGPGGSSIELFANQAIPAFPKMKELLNSRDLVFVEQRGTLYSKPSMLCPEEIAPMLAAAQGLADENDLTFLQPCHDRLQAEGVNFDAFNSIENAADMYAVAQALGYKSFNYYGVSYGTLLGQYVIEQAEEHPVQLRSVTIDAVVAPDVDFNANSGNTGSYALRNVFAECVQHEACRREFPDLEQVTLSLIDQLNREPISITLTVPASMREAVPDAPETLKTTLDGDDLVGVIFHELYQTTEGQVLPRNIFNTAKNNDYGWIERIQSSALEPSKEARAMYFTMLCSRQASLKSDGNYFGQPYPEFEFRRQGDEFARACDIMKVAPEAAQPFTFDNTDIPTLILNGTHDPITPLPYGEYVGSKLQHAYVYTFPGSGHGAIPHVPCAFDIMADFLADPAQAPESGCLSAVQPVFLGYPTPLEQLTLVTTTLPSSITVLLPSQWKVDPVSQLYMDPNNPNNYSNGAATVVLVPGKSVEDMAKQLGNDFKEVARDVAVGNRQWLVLEDRSKSFAVVRAALAEDAAGLVVVQMAADPFTAEAVFAKLWEPILSSVKVGAATK